MPFCWPDLDVEAIPIGEPLIANEIWTSWVWFPVEIVIGDSLDAAFPCGPFGSTA